MLGTSRKVKISFLKDFDTHIIDCIGDGSCMVHAIMQSFYKRYIEANSFNERIDMADEFRRNLAEKLTEINPRDAEGRTYYESLGNGTIAEIGEDAKEFSLEEFFSHLNSREFLDNRVIEYIQIVLNKSIFFVHEKRDSDGNIISKDMYNYFFHPSGQKSICLYGITEEPEEEEDGKILVGHYDLLGVKENGVMKTYFGPNHPFIKKLQSRMREVYTTFE